MIQTRGLTRTYGSRAAVRDVTITVEPGKVTALVGPNGAGKSTLLRMLVGLTTSDSGTALIHGRRYQDIDRPLRLVGAALDCSALHPARTGRAHLRWLAATTGVSRDRIEQVLAMVELTPAASRPVRTYSLGMRQRLCLAAALLGDPPVLILDEPTNGLDPHGIAWMRGLVRGWADERRTVLVSTHHVAELDDVTDRVLVLSEGALVGDLDAGLVRSRFGSLERAALTLTGGSADQDRTAS